MEGLLIYSKSIDLSFHLFIYFNFNNWSLIDLNVVFQVYGKVNQLFMPHSHSLLDSFPILHHYRVLSGIPCAKSPLI